MTRAFVAIRPPTAVLDAIDARFAPVAVSGSRPTLRDQWHITLQFLGNDADVEAVAAAFELAPLGHVRDVEEQAFRPHLTLVRFRKPTGRMRPPVAENRS